MVKKKSGLDWDQDQDKEYQRLFRNIIPLVEEIQRLKKLKRQLRRRTKGTNRSRKTNTV